MLPKQRQTVDAYSCTEQHQDVTKSTIVSRQAGGHPSAHCMKVVPKGTSDPEQPHQEVDVGGEEDGAETQESSRGPTADPYETPAEKWRRRRILAVYLLATTILHADLALLAPNLSEIADEFGFDDDERDVKLGGYIALGFFSLSFPVALLIGWLADFCNRSPLYAATVFLGEAACLGTYFVKTYPQLFVTRLLTGVSISGSLPVIFSVLGDLYPSSQRNAVAAIVTTGTGLGAGVGQALAGFLGPSKGWRFPFLVVSIPGMLCSLLLLCIQDPPRGRKEAARIALNEAIRNKQAKNQHECSPEEHALEPSGGGYGTKEPAVVPNDPCRHEHKALGLENGNATTLLVDDRAPEEEQEVVDDKVSWKTTKEMITTPTVALVLLGAAPGALPFGFGSVFLNDYLAEDRGMTVEVRW
jgi:MFS family permease